MIANTGANRQFEQAREIWAEMKEPEPSEPLADAPLADEDWLVREILPYDERLLAGEDVSPGPLQDSRVRQAWSVLLQLEQAGRSSRGDTLPLSSTGRATLPAEASYPDRIGRFGIRRQIGAGGFGIVLLAYDPDLRREVAIKVPRLGALLAPELRERFLREARAVAALDHPHIISVYEAGEDEGLCYIVTAYCPGPTLETWIRSQWGREPSIPVPPRLAACLLEQLAQAVHHAHSRGVLHRDLKPANVLLEPCSTSEQPREPMSVSEAEAFPFTLRIADFGLAKLQEDEFRREDEQATRTGQLLGTARYMAPEQATSRPVGPACDVYALGVILYELLTGRPPLVGDSELETLELVRKEDPVPPRRLRHRLPRDLETICLLCLRKEPDKRYRSAAALAEDLRRFLRGEPIQARRMSPGERFGRWCRRNPLPAGLLAAVVLITAVGFAGVAWQWHRADANFQRSEHFRQQSDHRFEQAWLAVQKLLDEVGGVTLEGEPRLEAVRRALLEEALVFYEQFLADSDAAAMRTKTAQAYGRVGTVNMWLGHRREAFAAFDKAIGMLEEQVAQRGPVAAADLHELARVRVARGLLNDEMLRLEQAEADLRRAAELFASIPLGELPQRDAAGHDVKSTGKLTTTQFSVTVEQARAEFHWARLLAQLGNHDEAARRYQTAIATLDRLHAEHPESPLCSYTLGHALEHYARLLAATRLSDPQVESTFRRALAIIQPLVEAHPLPDYRQLLQSTHNSLAIHLGNVGRSEEAIAQYQAALDLIDELNRDVPGVPAYRSELAIAYGNLAWACGALGQWERAEPAYARAIQLVQELVDEFHAPRDVDALANMLNNFGLAQLQAGVEDQAESSFHSALEIRREQIHRSPDQPVYRSQLGATLHNLAEISQRQENWSRATALLQEAIEHQEAALQTDPRNFTYRSFLRNHHWSLANAQRASAERSEAKRSFDRALQIAEALCREAPDARPYAAQRNSIALGLAQLVLADPSDPTYDPQTAIVWLKRATASSPGFRNYWLWLGIAHYRHGQLEEARAALQHGLSLGSDEPASYGLYLALVHAARDDGSAAAKCFAQARKSLAAGDSETLSESTLCSLYAEAAEQLQAQAKAL